MIRLSRARYHRAVRHLKRAETKCELKNGRGLDFK